MKKALFICAVSAAVIVTACCGGKQKVSAIMAGPEKVAGVVIEYAEAIDAESVCPEAFVVEGKEVVCAKVTEPNKVGILFKKDCCAKESVGECGEAKAECGEKHGCEKKAKCEKAEIAVPDIAVQQVVDIKTAEGKTIKAWKKAVKASEVICAPHHGRRHHKCGEGKCDKPAEEQCDKCKAAAQAE